MTVVRRSVTAIAAAAGIFTLSGSKALACSLALVMALDISGSVDDAEYALQQQGLADALIAPQVQLALLSTTGGAVRMMIFEWSAGAYQNVIVPWTIISGSEDITEISRELRAHPRGMAPFPTSIGNAMNFAAESFNEVPECRRKTLDISGDGPSNSWPPPERVRVTPPFRDITVNALVIGSSEPLGSNSDRSQLSELLTYYQEQVIHGPGAFAEPVNGFHNYKEAMIRKLLRELEGPLLSALQ